VEDERHDVGILMLAALLRREGYKVDFLGADAPTDDLINYAEMEKPVMVCVSASTLETAEPLKRLGEALRTMTPSPILGFGGRVFLTHPLLRHSINGQFLGESVIEACAVIRQVLGNVN
jgi:methanogenic corrinoid protein MtbC1